MKIIDGRREEDNVWPQDIADWNGTVTTKSSCVLSVGSKLEYEVVSSNLLRIYDGMLQIQGVRGKVDMPYDEIFIENGTQGFYRHDLIVARYTYDDTTKIEDMKIEVIKGFADRTDPEIHSNAIIRDGADTADYALYRVRLNGIEIDGIDTLFTVLGDMDKRIFDITHPVKSYIHSADDRNPSEYIPGGSHSVWELIGAGQGLTNVDASDAKMNEARKTYGAKTASTPLGGGGTSGGTAITTAQMPSHGHGFKGSALASHNHSQGGHQHYQGIAYGSVGSEGGYMVTAGGVFVAATFATNRSGLRVDNAGIATGATAATNNGISAGTPSGTVENNGSGNTHAHTTPDHSHTASTLSPNEVCYIWFRTA